MMRFGLLLALILGTGSAAAAADDLDSSYQSLQEALNKKDPALVKKLAAQTATLARQAASEAAPESADEKDNWKKRVAYANEIETYTEYSLYAMAVQSDTPVLIDLMTTLEAQNPKSKYLDQGYGAYLVALAKSGETAKVTPVAEKAIANFPDNPDLLLVLAEAAVTRKQSDRALSYANRLVAALGKRPKPENLPAADWERERDASLGRGYFIAGAVYAEKNRWIEADKDLRAALPLIKGQESMLGAALFQLGVANYTIGKATLDKAKMLEGAKFSDQASKINGPYAHQAWLNAQNIRTEASKMR
jgi:hypothetical protein